MIGVLDRGFLFGDAVYETGRSYDRKFLFWEDHFQRLMRSAATMGIECPYSEAWILGRLSELSGAFKQDNLYFRIILTRGVIDHVGLDVFSSETKPTVAMVVQSLGSKNDEKRKTGVSLMTSSVVRNSASAQDPNIKTSNYLNCLFALREVRARGGEDAVLCDAKGIVTEGTTFAVFGVRKDGVLITPSLETGILDSITRRHIIAIAEKIMPVEVGFFSVKEFLACDEVFMASSVRELMPVRLWDQRSYVVPGSVTSKLHELFGQQISRYLQNAVAFY